MIPRDLTIFVSAGVLDPNTSPASAQPVPCQSPPLPTEEWVCIEDYYSDEELSGTMEAARVSRELQSNRATSRSVCLALPSTDTVADSASSVSGMTVSPPSVASSVPMTATLTALESGAHLQALATSPLEVAAAPAQRSPSPAAQSVESDGIMTQPASSAAPRAR